MKFLSGTMLSRITGVGRDMAMAFCFGTHPALASFMIAYRFVYLMRRLFGEGLLHQGFIPHFESLRATSPKASSEFFRDLFSALTLFLAVFILLGEGALMLDLRLGFGKELCQLSMAILPGLFFISLYGLTSALLQCEKQFFLPSFAPAVCNLVWILGVFALYGQPMEWVALGLSFTIVIGFAVQWLITMPKTLLFLRQTLTLRECFRPHLLSPEVRKLIGPLFLGVIGVASTQINSAVDAIFARYASLEGPAYLWYAIRIQQLPLALFGIALSSALLPSLSRALQQKDENRYFELLRFALQRGFTLVFPCTIALYILGASGVNLLFGRGDFTLHATEQTLLCLWGYGIGLPAAVFVQILAPAFYAQKDYRTPAVGFALAAGLNILFNALLIFYFKLGAGSVALATSFTAFFNCVYLWIKFRQKYGTLVNSAFLVSCGKIFSSSVIAGGIVFAMGAFFAGDPSLDILLRRGPILFERSFSTQLLQFSVQAAAFALLFLSYAFVFRARDLLDMLGIQLSKKT